MKGLKRITMRSKIKRFFIISLLVFLMGGIYLNSNQFNGYKDEVYADLKEKTHLSSDTITEEEIIVEAPEEIISESTEEETVEIAELKEEIKEVKTSKKNERNTENIIWDYLIDAGYTDIQTAAIIGNLYQESKLDPSRVESNGVGIGLVQWSYGRRTELEKYAASKDKKWQDLTTQLEFLIKELKGGKQFYGTYKKTFYNPYSIDEATEAFCNGFERPDARYANMAYRKQMAWKTYYNNINR